MGDWPVGHEKEPDCVNWPVVSRFVHTSNGKRRRGGGAGGAPPSPYVVLQVLKEVDQPIVVAVTVRRGDWGERTGPWGEGDRDWPVRKLARVHD